MHQIQTHQSAYFAKEMPFKSLPHDHLITFFSAPHFYDSVCLKTYSCKT